MVSCESLSVPFCASSCSSVSWQIVNGLLTFRIYLLYVRFNLTFSFFAIHLQCSITFTVSFRSVAKGNVLLLYHCIYTNLLYFPAYLVYTKQINTQIKYLLHPVFSNALTKMYKITRVKG